MKRGEAGIACAVGQWPFAESEYLASEPGRALEQLCALLGGCREQRSLEQLRCSSECHSALEFCPRGSENAQTSTTGALLDRSKKPRLPDPRRARDDDEARATARSTSDQRVQSGELALALQEAGACGGRHAPNYRCRGAVKNFGGSPVAGQAACQHNRRMEEHLHRLELTVELDPMREPISGRVTDTRGQRRTFSGWLDLMDILDDIRQDVELQPASDARARGRIEHSDRREEAK